MERQTITSSKIRFISLIALIAAPLIVPFTLTQPVHAAASTKKLTADDYIEIQQLYAAYCWALDTGDGAARAATFTPDGVFLSSISKHKGEPAEVIGERTTKNGHSYFRHVMTNIQITPTADGADGRAYAVIMSGETMPGMITGTPAFYNDKLVKTAQGWRFKTREVWLDQEEDSPYRGKSPSSGPLMFVRKPQ